MRVSSARLVVGALTVGGVALVPFGALAGASSSAEQVVKQAISATESVSSVKFSGSVTQGTQTTSLDVFTSTSGAGEGTIGIGGGEAKVRLVGGTVYFMGNTKFWTQQDSASAAQLFAGRWVSTAATTSSGKSLTQFLSLTMFMKALFDVNLSTSSISRVGSATVAGKSTIVIAVKAKSGTTGRFYVAKSGEPYVLEAVIGGTGGSGTVSFSDYNKPVNPVAPRGAVDLDTLGDSG